ncbi:MAG: hypothetical protein ABSG79_23850 [Bryobacteraceae bacterium]
MIVYRHLFYPSSSRMTGTHLDLGYTIIELSGAGDSPGNGQHQVERVLHDQKKLLDGGDIPDSPPFVRDQTGLRVKGEMTTARMRTEYRRAPKLSILLHDTPLYRCIRNGTKEELFICRDGSQVWIFNFPAPGRRNRSFAPRSSGSLEIPPATPCRESQTTKRA